MFIKRPGGARRTYALVGNDNKTVQDKRIDQINQDLKNGVPMNELEDRMKAILRDLSGKRFTSLAPTNLKLVERLHSEKLIRKPYLVNPEGLKRQLIRAVEALGPISVREASELELLTAIKHIKRPASRRDIIRSLNEILKYAGRTFRLPNPPIPRVDDIVFIRVKDFLKASNKFTKEYEIYLGALFATGCRFGELPLAQFDVSYSKVTVKAQVRKDGSIGQTKNKKIRTAPILPPLEHYTHQLRNLDLKELRLKHQKNIYLECKKYLGIRVHDLRHSYAVEWGAVGTGTGEIAEYIGNTEKVCKKHYRNYCTTDDSIERARSRFKV